MHDPLDAIRRLYGESGEALPAEGAELKALAEMKAALDGLPPRRPAPAVVDAVVTAAAEAVRPPALEPIRAVYDEDAAELESEAARAEVRALEAVKEGLDVLPRQRPDASLIDAVVKSAGEAVHPAVLAPIRMVYDEEPTPLASPAAEVEATALTEMKAALDGLPPRRPDASVIDAVLAAAGQPAKRTEGRPAAAAAGTGRAADRPARPARRDTRRRIATVLGAVFAVVLVFGGGLWLNQEAPDAAELAVADREVAGDRVAEATPSADDVEAADTPEAVTATPPESQAAAPADDGLLAAAAPPPQPTAESEAGTVSDRAAPEEATGAPSTFAAGATAPAVASDPTASDDVQLAEALALDDDDELRLMYLRLREMQDGQAGLGWDTPPVALGAAPDSTLAPPATGWMQVRVQR